MYIDDSDCVFTSIAGGISNICFECTGLDYLCILSFDNIYYRRALQIYPLQDEVWSLTSLT
jgi:hypothetical protein